MVSWGWYHISDRDLYFRVLRGSLCAKPCMHDNMLLWQQTNDPRVVGLNPARLHIHTYMLPGGLSWPCCLCFNTCFRKNACILPREMRLGMCATATVAVGIIQLYDSNKGLCDPKLYI